MDLRTYLFKARITQVDFAKMMGVSRCVVSNWIRGLPPRESMVKKIEKLTEGKVTVKEMRRGKPYNHFICPTCKCRRRVKKKLKSE